MLIQILVPLVLGRATVLPATANISMLLSTKLFLVIEELESLLLLRFGKVSSGLKDVRMLHQNQYSGTHTTIMFNPLQILNHLEDGHSQLSNSLMVISDYATYN